MTAIRWRTGISTSSNVFTSTSHSTPLHSYTLLLHFSFTLTPLFFQSHSTLSLSHYSSFTVTALVHIPLFEIQSSSLPYTILSLSLNSSVTPTLLFFHSNSTLLSLSLYSSFTLTLCFFNFHSTPSLTLHSSFTYPTLFFHALHSSFTLTPLFLHANSTNTHLLLHYYSTFAPLLLHSCSPPLHSN